MTPNSDRVQDLSRFALPKDFRGRSVWIVQLWWFVQASFFRHSPQGLYGFRRWLLRLFGAKVGRGVLLRPSVRITYPWKLSIGDHAWIGDDAVLYSLGPINLGANSVVSQRSYLCAATHDYRSATFDIVAQPIAVGEMAWLAADVFVAPGVTIGAGCVVGARSAVFGDLPPMMLCFGSPAKPVGPRLQQRDQR
jgi:putative colanic acid biosynthesis acetyltransferase WcaF